MSRPKKFVEKLSTEEIATLEQGQKYGPSPDFRQRCQGILLSHQGYEMKQISDILGCGYLAVTRWIKKWETTGLGGLIRKSGQGRPRKLLLNDPEHVATVKEVTKEHAQNSRQILEEVKTKLEITNLSTKSLHRFLKKIVIDGSDSAEA